MLTGSHVIVYAKDHDATRAFFRDVLKFPSVDAGEGWLIFGLPPAELGVHPTEGEHGGGGGDHAGRHELFFTCDDVVRTRKELEAKGVRFEGEIADHGWGILTTMLVPGLGKVGVYQPRHPQPHAAPAKRRKPARRAAPARAKAKAKGRAKPKARAKSAKRRR